MTDADGIVADFFQNLNLSLFRLRICARTKESVIVMDTAAFQVHLLSIQPESVDRIHFNLSDTKSIFRLIRNFSVFADGNTVGIQIRMLQIPKRRIFHSHLYILLLFSTYLHGFLHFSNNFSTIIQDFTPIVHGLFDIGSGDHGIYIYHRFFFTDFRCGHEHIPRLHADRTAHPQAYITIESAATVPAGRRLSALGEQFQFVFLPVKTKRRCQIYLKRNIAVRMHRKQCRVQQHFQIHIRPVDIQNDLLSFPLFRDIQRLLIHTFPVSEISVCRSTRCIGTSRFSHDKIMRQIHFLTRRCGKYKAHALITLIKIPVFV